MAIEASNNGDSMGIEMKHGDLLIFIIMGPNDVHSVILQFSL